VHTYPMKGTIDASVPNAQQVILQDAKEKAEHYTIVDLLRNDLSVIANDVQVNQFRYIDTLHTSNKTLLQISSQISGQLSIDWHDAIGDLLAAILPAGSISGAPKKKTLEIIAEAETHDRGYYTGIAGYYDGVSLDTCVLIRFIEKTNNGLVYKSGGGITCNSDVQKEYEELNQKIYIPY
jgi:para-aminobenzoate synthetase component I